MQAYPEILLAVAFIGYRTERGFDAEGTCFLVVVREDELDFHYVVTCKHVVRTITERGTTEPVIRVNRKGEAPRPIPVPPSRWVDHPDRFVDVSVCPDPIADDDQDDEILWSPIVLADLADDAAAATLQSLGVGDVLFMPSLFAGRVGDRRNVPVLRVATLAAMAEEPVWRASPRRAAFLVETKSLGGTSGSPVFLNAYPHARIQGAGAAPASPRGGHGLPYLLIGMYLGGHSGRYATDFGGAAEDGEGEVVPTDADFNAGIGVVLPTAQILEALDQPALRDARAATLAKKRSQSGFRPA